MQCILDKLYKKEWCYFKRFLNRRNDASKQKLHTYITIHNPFWPTLIAWGQENGPGDQHFKSKNDKKSPSIFFKTYTLGLPPTMLVLLHKSAELEKNLKWSIFVQ